MIKITHELRRGQKSRENDANVRDIVAEIIERVGIDGDEALREYERKFDGTEITSFSLSGDDIDKALSSVDEEYIMMLARGAENIRKFHERQKNSGYIVERDGALIGQRVIPLESVALYVPGGTASYPSTVLMTAIPAKIAGCKRVCVITPPPASNKVIAAAFVAGVTDIFTVGGAQAVAACAFGTQSIPKVDKIVGPGNIFVTEAKRQVMARGLAAIDNIAGPSEVLIIADKNADSKLIAADMLAQSEHDKNASAILITTDENLAHSVSDEIEKQIASLPRHDIARASIDNNGAIIITKDIDTAVRISDSIAPEHLELFVDDPFGLMTKVRNAGSIFLGSNSPEALGDYYAGSNHTLPTMGTAKFASPLSVDDFVKKSQFIYYTNEALRRCADDVEMFALSEGLHAHARSITIRTCTEKNS